MSCWTTLPGSAKTRSSTLRRLSGTPPFARTDTKLIRAKTDQQNEPPHDQPKPHHHRLPAAKAGRWLIFAATPPARQLSAPVRAELGWACRGRLPQRGRNEVGSRDRGHGVEH